MGNLDIDSLFTNILIEESIEIYTNNLFNNRNIVQGLKKWFKDLLSSATKNLYFLVNNILYKQIDGVATGSSLGPSVANAFLTHHE